MAINTQVTDFNDGEIQVIEVSTGIRGESSQFFTGINPPSSALGGERDMYLVTQGTDGLGNVYQKISGTWELRGNIRGADGSGTSTVSSVNTKTGDVILTADDVTSGKFVIGVIPTGTTATTVALGNHNHAGVYEPLLGAGTTSQYLRGDRTWQTLNKGAIGLDNVDNTSDLAKPISTATQSALAGKANTSHAHSLADASITGVLPIAKIPTGTTSSTVALGDHTHTIAGISGLQSALDSKETVSGAQNKASTAETNAKQYADTIITNIVGTAPAALDTLNELAVALGNNPNFATTVTSQIASKENSLGIGTATQYLRGDKTWQTLSKDAVGLSNVDNTSDMNKPISSATQSALNNKANSSHTHHDIYYTESEVDLLLTTKADLSHNHIISHVSGLQAALDAKEPALGSGAADTFLSSARQWVAITKSDVGLSNVDNTADLAKPISTATQTALNAKVSTTGNETIAGIKTFSSAPVVPDNSFTIAKTSGLQNELTSLATDRATMSYVKSRGTDLVTNGTGYLNNNTNFSWTTFNSADAPEGANGSFVTLRGSQTRVSDELIPVDLGKKYILSVWLRETTTETDSRGYTGFSPQDSFGQGISPQHYMCRPGTLTELTQQLNPGDTVMKVSSTANWKNNAGASAHWRNIIWWDYVDPGGKAWPPETFSRNTMSNAYNDGGITDATTITLSSPYSGPTRPVGTKLSNGGSGGTYMYSGAVNNQITNVWTQYKSFPAVGGLHTQPTTPGVDPTSAVNKFPPGTASVRLVFLLNRTVALPYNNPNAQTAIAGVSLSDASAAQATADSALALATAHTHTKSQITDFSHTHAVTDISATGRTTTNFLRGDGTWATPTNTTYSAATQTEIENSGSTTASLITGQRVYQAIAAHARLNTWTPSWTDVSGKPSTFAPAAHNHTVSDISAGGTPSANTFLRGDGSWAVPEAGSEPAPALILISQAEATNSSSTAERAISGQRLYQGIAAHARLNTWVPSWTDVTGKPTTFTPATHGHALTDANITGVLPIAQIPASVYHEGHKPTWAEVDGKPTTFTPETHGHALTDANITGVLPIAQVPTGTTASTVALGNHTHTYVSITGTPTLGTAAALNVAASGNAATGEVVKGNDTRLTNPRTPTTHVHPISEITATGTASSATYLRGDGTWATPTNTTYTLITQAEAESSSSTTARLVSGQRLSQAVTAYAPVKSVAGKTGVVTLAAADVGAAPASHNHDTAYYTKNDVRTLLADALNPVRDCLHSNRSFENDLTSWSAIWKSANGTLAISTTEYFTGTKSAMLTMPATNDYVRVMSGDILTLVPGQTVKVSCWVKTSGAPSSVRIGLVTTVDGANPDYFQQPTPTFHESPDFEVGGTWKYHSATFVVPATHVRGRFMVRGTNFAASQSIMYIDETYSAAV